MCQCVLITGFHYVCIIDLPPPHTPTPPLLQESVFELHLQVRKITHNHTHHGKRKGREELARLLHTDTDLSHSCQSSLARGE